MTDFQHLIYELEDYARQNGGRFWLLDVPGRSSPPPALLKVVVEFEHGAMQAAIFVDIVCKKNRVPFKVYVEDNLPEAFKHAILPNALVLMGPPYDRQTNRIEAAEYFRNRYPWLVGANLNFDIRYGWSAIFEDYLKEVLEIVRRDDVFELRGIRQRYGMLDIAYRLAPSLAPEVVARIAEAADKARERSQHTCEICGQPGSLRMEEGGRIYTACDIHGAGDKPLRRVSGHE
jgi:hypothetical protein